ncbi:MAG: chemotaxis response regulator protein-glutamate methylesterase, partial [Pseudomonadota bacterium]
MIVDDSAVIRGLFARVLEADGDGIKVVASVGDGALALKALERYDIDIVLLDIEMPNMDGLTALPKLVAAKPGLVVIMASSLTERNADISLRALRMGATDYVTKPSSREALRSADEFKRDLVSKVKALGRRGNDEPSNDEAVKAASPRRPVPRAGGKGEIVLRQGGMSKPQVIAIGSSTGGPQALAEVLKSVTQSIDLPILVTQHMPPTFTSILATHMGQTTGWACAEAQDGDIIQKRHIYIAPGGRHMLVEAQGSQKIIRLSDDPPVNFCRPAVDPMLTSIAKAYGPSVLVTILTGMGYDGRAGSEDIVHSGGTVIAQDEETSVVWGMPGAVATSGLCSAVLPLSEIG